MLKWIGGEKGMAGLPGVPGRDLSEEEIGELPVGWDRQALLDSGLYVERKPKKKAEKPEKEV